MMSLRVIGTSTRNKFASSEPSDELKADTSVACHIAL